MTLVAGFSVGGLPAFVGDLLLSRLLPSDADLPTLPKPGRVPGLDRHYASDLGQKLVIVRPWIMVAWAGSMSNAHRIIRGIDAVLSNDPGDYTKDTAVFQLLNSCEEGSELMALIIRKGSVHPLLVRTAGFELDGKRIYLMGSGRHQFFEYLESNPGVLPGQENGEGLHARALALRFGARAMATQWITGSGLEESWGGGFEFVYPDRDRVFRKADKVLFRGWGIDADGGYSNIGRSFFLRYYGSDLYLSCFSQDETTYVIPSVVGGRGKVPTYEACSPTWTVDTFFHMPTASLVEAVRFTPSNGQAVDVVELEDGKVRGWRMDRAYVEGLVRSAKGVAGREAFFFSGWPQSSSTAGDDG